MDVGHELAGDVGIGVYAQNSSGLTLSSVLVSNCNGRGIAILNDPDVVIRETTSVENRGGLIFDNSQGLIERCRFVDNQAANYYEINGAGVVASALFPLENEDATDTVDEDENGAGLLLLRGSSPSIVNCLITGNWTWADDPDYSEGKLVPDYGLGGGFYIGEGCAPTGVNCTVADNHANTRGGGLSSHESPFLRNMIFWGNTASNATIVEVEGEEFRLRLTTTDQYPNLHCRSGTINIWYSDIEYGYSTARLSITDDPLFEGLGDYHLQTNSLCIDRGTFFLAPTNDLDGLARPVALPDRVDMGCYEYTGFVPAPDPLADEDGDGMSNGDEWIAGTDWEDSNDFFSVTTTYDASGPSTLVIWASKTQRVYTVQTTTNLLFGTWAPVVPGWTNNGTGGMLIYTNTYSDTPRYFQVDVWKLSP